MSETVFWSVLVVAHLAVLIFWLVAEIKVKRLKADVKRWAGHTTDATNRAIVGAVELEKARLKILDLHMEVRVLEANRGKPMTASGNGEPSVNRDRITGEEMRAIMKAGRNLTDLCRQIGERNDTRSES